MNWAGLYNNESWDIIDDIDLVSDFEERRCFEVDHMDASDHDKKLSSDEVKTVAQCMEFMCKKSCKKHKMSGEISHFQTMYSAMCGFIFDLRVLTEWQCKAA